MFARNRVLNEEPISRVPFNKRSLAICWLEWHSAVTVSSTIKEMLVIKTSENASMHPSRELKG